MRNEEQQADPAELSSPRTASTDPSNDPSSSPDPSATPVSSEPKAERGLVAHRTFNCNVVVLGKPGSGKSEYAVRRALLMARTPCYVVAHDVGWKIPDTLHDGTPTYVKRHRDAQAAREAINKDPKGIHAISSADAEPVFQLARELAAHSLEANGGDKGVPVLLVIDEVVSAGICDPNRLDPGFKRLLAERRHDHVGILSTCQSARMLHNQVVTLATEVVLFRITDKRDQKRLVEAGLDEELVASIGNLPPHKFVRTAI